MSAPLTLGTAGLTGTTVHKFGPQSIDLSASTGSHQLRIDIKADAVLSTASGFKPLMKSIPPSAGLAGRRRPACPTLLGASSRRESDRLENVLSTVFENDCEMV